MDEEVYISIDRYLANDMTADERLAFEERLQNDSTLLQKLEIYKSNSVMLNAKVKREEREAIFKTNLNEILAEDQSGVKVIKLNWYTWAVAASVAILCVVLFYTTLSKPSYEEFASYEPIALVERSSENKYKLEAQTAFNDHHYTRAAELFNLLLEQDPKNSELQLYKGIALLETNQINEAKALFREVRTSRSIYTTRATWMLALSALKEKDYEACKSLLKEIPKDADDYEKAQALLNKL